MVKNFVGENNPNFKHGMSDGTGFRHPVYTAWQNMKARCFNEKHEKFHRYGGRGITVCQSWLTSKNFCTWAIQNGWQKGLSLDRKDNDGNYEPDNCHWVLVGRNSRKKSTTKLTLDEVKTIRQKVKNGENECVIAKEFNVTRGTIWFIVRNFTWDETL